MTFALRAGNTDGEDARRLGEAAFVSLQHRAVDEASNRGSLLMISGFRVRQE